MCKQCLAQRCLDPDQRTLPTCRHPADVGGWDAPRGCSQQSVPRDAFAVTSGEGGPPSRESPAKSRTAAPSRTTFPGPVLSPIHRRMFQRGCCASPWRRSGSSSSSCCCWCCSPRPCGSPTCTSTRARPSSCTSTTEKVESIHKKQSKQTKKSGALSGDLSSFCLKLLYLSVKSIKLSRWCM